MIHWRALKYRLQIALAFIIGVAIASVVLTGIVEFLGRLICYDTWVR